MGSLKKNIQQNKGFTLLELLVAISILAILTVPLINSFITAGRVGRDSRRMQNATTAAQSVMEHLKTVTDLSQVEPLLKAAAVSDASVIKTSAVSDSFTAYSLQVEGDDGEAFTVNLRLDPKNEYDYQRADFMDVYEEASVIYSELVLNDSSILTAMENEPIDYAYGEAHFFPGKAEPELSMAKWNPDLMAWDASWSPSENEKLLRATYGNLFADEYIGGALPGGPEGAWLTRMYEDFKKENITKVVDITIRQTAGASYQVLINTSYSMDYAVVFLAEDPDYVPETAEGDDSIPGPLEGMAFYRYWGTLLYEAEEIELTLDADKPIYLLYAKSTAGDAGHFANVECNILCDSSIHLDAGKTLELYLVEQGQTEATLTELSYMFHVKNESGDTPVTVYTTEHYNTMGFPIDTIAGQGNTVIYSNDESHSIAYSLGDFMTALYKITVSVSYDGETIYTIATED